MSCGLAAALGVAAVTLTGCAEETTARAAVELSVEGAPLSGGESGSLQGSDTLWAMLSLEVQDVFAACGLEGFSDMGPFISLLSYNDLYREMDGYGVGDRPLDGEGTYDNLSQTVWEELYDPDTDTVRRAKFCDHLRSRVVLGNVAVPGNYTTAAGNTIRVDEQGRVALRPAKVVATTPTGQVVDVEYAIPGPASLLERNAYQEILAADYPELAQLLALTPDLLAGLAQEHITLLAPTPAAFAKLPPGRFEALLTDEALRRAVLARHVVASPVLNLSSGLTYLDLDANPVSFNMGGWGAPTVNQMAYDFSPTYARGAVIYPVQGVFGETATYWDEWLAEYQALQAGS